MLRVKICGITNLEDAQACAAAGAHLLGFNFYPHSPRYISPLAAHQVIKQLPEQVVGAGIFVNLRSPADVMRLVEDSGVSAVQLHGEESPEFCAELKQLLGARLLIKALRAGPDFDPIQATHYPADAILLDGFDDRLRGGSGRTCDWSLARKTAELVPRLILAGGLTPNNVAEAIAAVNPYGVDACGGLESSPGRKDLTRVRAFIAASKNSQEPFPTEQRLPDETGHWGRYGGRYVPETLIAPLEELTSAYFAARSDAGFMHELSSLLRDYSGRPTPLTYASRLTEAAGGARVYLKREDLSHTGSHKINNALGQALLARRMGKKRIIAETGAGQHGVATATACALMNFQCVIYMGTEDMRRQELNVFRMRWLGAKVRAVDAGSRTLKDAINEALRDWVSTPDETYYLLGSALGPHPYPTMVRDFQSVIGEETRAQFAKANNSLPDALVACVGGGSNSIGLFYPFLEERRVRMIGVEAGGFGKHTGQHAARFLEGCGRPGVLQGTLSYVLQDGNGQIASTRSIAAGLDYPAVGPEHSYLHDSGRVEYVSVSDAEALNAFQTLSRLEGIIPALESAHAVSYAIRLAKELGRDAAVVVNLSGRGDKDVQTVAAATQ